MFQNPFISLCVFLVADLRRRLVRAHHPAHPGGDPGPAGPRHRPVHPGGAGGGPQPQAGNPHHGGSGDVGGSHDRLPRGPRARAQPRRWIDPGDAALRPSGTARPLRLPRDGGDRLRRRLHQVRQEAEPRADQALEVPRPAGGGGAVRLVGDRRRDGADPELDQRLRDLPRAGASTRCWCCSCSPGWPTR